MNHYEYQKTIALFCLDKQYFDNKPPRSPQDDGSICTLSTTISTVWSCGSARSRISASALNPLTGALKGRLNRGTAHWQLNPSFAGMNKANCQMHWWVTGKRKYKNVDFYKECNVSLCTNGCYELFHTCWDIESEKENLRLAFKKNISEDTAMD